MSEEELNAIVKEHYGFTVEEIDSMVGNLSLKINQLEYNHKKLMEEKQQLKEWLEEMIDYEEYDKIERDTFKKVLSKIQEIEGGTNV